MKNKIPVRKKPAHIMVKSSPVSNITYYEYCFENDLKNNNGCEFFVQKLRERWHRENFNT